MPNRDQPPLHALVSCVRAPTAALSGDDGQLRAEGAHGLFHADVRVLSRAVLRVGGAEPLPVLGGLRGTSGARFVGLPRDLGDRGVDPVVRVERRREVRPGGMDEEIRVASRSAGPVDAEVTVELAADLASVRLVNSGRAGEPAEIAVRPSAGDAAAAGGDALLAWAGSGVTVEVGGTGAVAVVRPDRHSAVLGWRVRMDGPGERTLRWRVRVRDTGAVVVTAPGPPPWSTPEVRADDRRLPALLSRSLADLDGLRMATADRPDDGFLAAGSPWYFTLFGRDSLLAARMLLPLGTPLPAGTLRTLAARQGRRVDPVTGEAPGKIPHELRREMPGEEALELHLPPLYYGTVDATPLWVCLLHDAWRWGLAADEVAALLPATEAALGWLTDAGDPDGDGFLEYLDPTGRGLANQGWKDSADAVRFADGRLASPPVALCEVQGYAYEAARHGADLLEAFGRPGADRWRDWADGLARRFRERFWVDRPDGRYPALALDAAKRPVDAVTTNMGHLLGTGLLDPAEEELVARRVTAPDLDSGYGLRTMSTRDAGYAPISYHCGSVWPHDTAIVLAGLVRSGQGARAAPVVEGLLAAGAAFDGRVPELYAGDPRDDGPGPVPYPAACRPQAWSAAAAVAVLQAVLGLDADVPNGRLRLAPLRPSPVGALRVDGLVAGARRLAVAVDADGTVTEVDAAGLTLDRS